MFAISEFGIVAPLIRPIESFNYLFGYEAFKVAHQDDVILAMEINPATVTLPGVSALSERISLTVENIIERLIVDIAQLGIKILAQGYITITVNDQTAHDALAAKSQVATPPLIIKCYKVIVLLCLVDVRGNTAHKIGRLNQLARGVKERHRAIDADAHVNAVMQGHIDDMLHVLERVPRRQAEHERQWYLVLQCLNDLNHLVIAVAAAHSLVGLLVSIKRDIQVARMIAPHGLDDTLWHQGVSQQRVIRVVLMKPCHDFISLWMQDKFASFKSDGRPARNATVLHDVLDVIERQVLTLFLPDVAVLAM